jgi:hypothetical protein
VNKKTSPKRAGRNQVLIELVRMRREIELLINSLTGDDNREFVKSLNDGHPVTVRSPRAGENLLSSDEIMEKFGLTDTDDDGELSADFIERFGHLIADAKL